MSQKYAQIVECGQKKNETRNAISDSISMLNAHHAFKKTVQGLAELAEVHCKD